MSARVAGIGTALPDQRFTQDELWSGAYAQSCGGGPVHRRLFRGAGVQQRHLVVNPLVEDVSGWSTGERMRRYVTEALPLGKEAVGAALADANLAAEDVGLFAVTSCTGYATPGIDIRTAASLGMAADVQRLVVGHMGCYAALPGLGAVADFTAARQRPSVLLCLELTSLHVQPPATELVLDRLRARQARHVVLLAFGPGLTLYAPLLTGRTELFRDDVHDPIAVDGLQLRDRAVSWLFTR
jgi:predicted naringenin-chalcone synthase